jgi:hypothetical protein
VKRWLVVVVLLLAACSEDGDSRTVTADDIEAEPEAEPEPEPEPEPELPERVVALPVKQAPRAWNLWELERLARERAGADVERDEERSFLLMYLREFASPEGTLPVDFDLLVRESFGELIATR